MATKKINALVAKKAVVKKKGVTAMKVGVSIAAGVAVALAMRALNSWMYSKSAAPQRKQAKAWVIKARKDVMREVGKLKNISASEYARIIDKAMERYAAFKEVNGSEIAKTAKEMKAEWKNIQAAARKATKMPGVKKAAPKKKGKA
jgi:hypothetical protein